MEAEPEGAIRGLHLRIRGRVQGVWYRGSAVERARALGLHGWIRNCADGTVEAVAEGTGTALQAFARWCGEGPPQARVSAVETDDRPAEGLRGFEIRR